MPAGSCHGLQLPSVRARLVSDCTAVPVLLDTDQQLIASEDFDPRVVNKEYDAMMEPCARVWGISWPLSDKFALNNGILVVQCCQNTSVLCQLAAYTYTFGDISPGFTVQCRTIHFILRKW